MLIAAAERYFESIRRIRSSGGATDEESYYGALENLFNDIGSTLDPVVFSVNELRDQGAGHPDFGLFSSNQPDETPIFYADQIPDRGVVEVKPIAEDAWLTADSGQVSRYWGLYRQVLVTNTRDFVLLGEDAAGLPTQLESLRLADTQQDFELMIQHPKGFANRIGLVLGEFISRCLSFRKTITEPSELAWLLASYARDALARVENSDDGAHLTGIRSALEQSLGVRFEGDDGPAFFRTTLVQTLFYGVFSAWVLWARANPFQGQASFDWHVAVWHMRSPILGSLFQQLSQPQRLRDLGLVHLLDLAGGALNRVDRNEFFAEFDQGRAVQYFYEPFLEQFDPDLRKQLGVWYTPPEVVQYMVARVDLSLKQDLGIHDGLAADNVYVLDPCCGTGSFLAEVLRRIGSNVSKQGFESLVGSRVRQAATDRIFGFEIMPAPLVIANLQIELTLQSLGGPLSDDDDRPGIYLTNALTGWEPTSQKPTSFPELEEERERADRVKQDAPILVVIGNPPYNGFAGLAIREERQLTEAYRKTENVRKPEGQGLNDLYIRFFRAADRRIAEKTGQGVICLISNYSWLDGLSFTGMREHYLAVFDEIRIDSLNGDVRKGGKTPNGEPDPSIFAVRSDSDGISVGTAITTLVRKLDHRPASTIQFRNLWGDSKRAELIATLESDPSDIYEHIQPSVAIGLPFKPITIAESWLEWPSLPELFPVSFPGVKTSRDSFLIDIDLERLKSRVFEYFDPQITHDEIAEKYPAAIKSLSKSVPGQGRQIREQLISMGGPDTDGFMRYTYRPFDNQWIYWDDRAKFIGRPRAEYKSQIDLKNIWIEARKHQTQEDFSRGSVVRHLGDNFGNGLSHFFPLKIARDGLENGWNSTEWCSNISSIARSYVDKLGLSGDSLFYHAIAALHGSVYRLKYRDTLRIDWPRIPLPSRPNANDMIAATYLEASSTFGRKIGRVLDPDTPLPGVTAGTVQPMYGCIAVPITIHGRAMMGPDFVLSSGWGHFGANQNTMPSRGKIVERRYTDGERASLGVAISYLGDETIDVYVNDRAHWSNVPTAVWNYKLGGYQVLKKWLSYRDIKVLGRALKPEEIKFFSEMARRIAALLKLADEYTRVVENEYDV